MLFSRRYNGDGKVMEYFLPTKVSELLSSCFKFIFLSGATTGPPIQSPHQTKLVVWRARYSME